MSDNLLIDNLYRMRTTPLGVVRIRRNVGEAFDSESDVVEWCRERIMSPTAQITRNGKNFYIVSAGFRLTVNAYSFTIITVHRV